MVTRKHWTKEDVYFLKRHIGKKSICWIAEHLERSPNAIRCKANDLKIAASDRYSSLQAIIRETGYNRKQLLKAKQELGQQWEWLETAVAGGRFKITDDQREELLNWLARPGPKYSSPPGPEPRTTWEPYLNITNCLHCGTNGRKPNQKHKALGLCHSCWSKLQRNKTKHRRHKLLINYWKLAAKNEAPIHTTHPINQLDCWNSFTTLPVDRLNLRVRIE